MPGLEGNSSRRIARSVGGCHGSGQAALSVRSSSRVLSIDSVAIVFFTFDPHSSRVSGDLRQASRDGSILREPSCDFGDEELAVVDQTAPPSVTRATGIAQSRRDRPVKSQLFFLLSAGCLALFYAKAYARIFKPGFQSMHPDAVLPESRLQSLARSGHTLRSCARKSRTIGKALCVRTLSQD